MLNRLLAVGWKLRQHVCVFIWTNLKVKLLFRILFLLSQNPCFFFLSVLMLICDGYMDLFSWGCLNSITGVMLVLLVELQNCLNMMP